MCSSDLLRSTVPHGICGRGCSQLRPLVKPTMTSLEPRMPWYRRALPIFAVLALVAAIARTVSGSEVGAAFGNPVAPPPPRATIVNNPARASHSVADVALRFDTLMGRSRRVLVRLVQRDEVTTYPGLLEHFGNEVLQPGVRSVGGAPNGATFSFITLMPWTRKLGTEINGYHVGWWPAERRTMPTNYDNPTGFVEVTQIGRAHV